MIRDRPGNINANKAFSQTTQPQVDIFQIRNEAFIESSEPIEHVSPVDARGSWRNRDRKATLHAIPGGFAVSRAPRASCPADQIVRAVDNLMIRGADDRSGGKTCIRGAYDQVAYRTGYGGYYAGY